jgi:hypothetical protein
LFGEGSPMNKSNSIANTSTTTATNTSNMLNHPER